MDVLPISVIIAAKNAEITIEECLTSVQRNNPAEIIVVDGVSSDRTVEVARRYTEKIYSDEGREFNYAQQLGAEQATQEYIAYVDADIVLPEGTLATMLAELKASDYASIQARLLTASLSTYWQRARDWNIRLWQPRRGIGLSAAVLRRSIAMKYKLDPFLKGGSDYDFHLRLEREGYELGLSSAFVYHHNPVDLKSLAKRQSFRVGWVFARYIWKYGPWHAGFWPPLATLYWLAICLIKGKLNFIPYFIVDGMVATAGMVKGFAELIWEALGRGQKSVQ